MKIEFVSKHLKNSGQIQAFTEDRIHTVLDRFENRVDRVTVRLEDETRDSKHFDGMCKIEVELHRGHIHVSAARDSAYECVAQAIHKMEHALKHELDRRRWSSRTRKQQARHKVAAVSAGE